MIGVRRRRGRIPMGTRTNAVSGMHRRQCIGAALEFM
jgi:hypothetical protein